MAAPAFTLKIDMHGLEQRLARAGADLDRKLRSAAFQAGARVQAEVVSRTPVDLGTARNDIALDVFGTGLGITARVAGHMEYLATLEFGRKPGKRPPPYESLLPWVKRHPAAPAGFLTAKGNRSNRKPPTDESRAFLIARAIGRRGLPAHHMFEEGLNVSEPFIRDTFEDAIRDLVRGLNQ